MRSSKEAVELARKWGVEIEEDVRFIASDPKLLPKNALAQYLNRRFLPDKRLCWDDLLNLHEQVAVKFSRELLSSDEAIVAVFAHEMHEINGLRALFEARETIPAVEVARLVNPGIKGNLHDQAWDAADEAVTRMRAGLSTSEVE